MLPVSLLSPDDPLCRNIGLAGRRAVSWMLELGRAADSLVTSVAASEATAATVGAGLVTGKPFCERRGLERKATDRRV